MHQLWIYILQGIFVGVCEKIDTAFGNNISIDAICVLSAYTVITWITYCTYQIGSYAFRVLLSKEKTCLLLTMLTSIILGVLVFCCSDVIPHLYTLTDAQYDLFARCLRMHALSIPLLALGEFLSNYILFKCMNKLIWVSYVVLYTAMISLDALVFFQGRDLEYIILTTGVSYLIYDLVLVIFSGIFKSRDKITLSDLKLCFKHGSNMLIDRLLGKVATITYNVYASKLGTEAFAIHSVCYSLAVFTENITNALFNFEVVKLALVDGVREKYKKCIEILKSNVLKLALLGYVLAFILLLFLHGDVSIKTCTIPLILYCSQVLFIQLYESLRGYITSVKRTDILKYAGLIGIFSRIPVTLISYYSGIGLYGFALASTIDFTCRGIYFYYCSKKVILRGDNLAV